MWPREISMARGLATRQVVMVDDSILRNGGPRTAVLTVDRIYFLVRPHELMVDPGRPHLPRFCDSTRIYVRIQWLSDSYVFVRICTRNREHYMGEERLGKSSRCPLISLHLSAKKLLVTILLLRGFGKKNSFFTCYSFVIN